MKKKYSMSFVLTLTYKGSILVNRIIAGIETNRVYRKLFYLDFIIVFCYCEP